MSNGKHYRIYVDLVDVTVEDGFTESDLLEALDGLANVMGVQAEDGVWKDGHPDSGVFIGDMQKFTVSVEEVDLDTAGSASRQHYIDTGRYLTHAEVAEANGPRHEDFPEPPERTELRDGFGTLHKVLLTGTEEVYTLVDGDGYLWSYSDKHDHWNCQINLGDPDDEWTMNDFAGSIFKGFDEGAHEIFVRFGNPALPESTVYADKDGDLWAWYPNGWEPVTICGQHYPHNDNGSYVPTFTRFDDWKDI